MSADAVTTQPRRISVVPLIDLSLRSIVVFVASILRTEKRGDIKGDKPAIFLERKHTGQ
jgi:biopolymer transport protein ExbD